MKLIDWLFKRYEMPSKANLMINSWIRQGEVGWHENNWSAR